MVNTLDVVFLDLRCMSKALSLLGYDMSIYIRRYSRYLTERALSYRLVAVDFTKMKRGWDICSAGEIFHNETNRTNGNIWNGRKRCTVVVTGHTVQFQLCVTSQPPSICSAQDWWSDAHYEHRKADEDSTYHSESAGCSSGLWGTEYIMFQFLHLKVNIEHFISIIVGRIV